MTPEDRLTVTAQVAVLPEVAFAVFTEEVDAWWGRGPRFRFRVGQEGVLRFEPEPGGRFLEDFGDGDVYEIGRVLAWDPPRRLEFEFRPREFGEEDLTIVEVGFAAEADGTRVTVVHWGWDTIPADHPARHGLVGPAFGNLFGGWWSEQVLRWTRRLDPSTG